MKIYVSIPVQNKDELKSFIKGLETLTSKGHKVIDIYKNESHPMPDDVDYHVNKFKQSEKAIKEADLVIVESSFPGRRQGFEIARAIDERKIVISLVNTEISSPKISTILGNTNKNFSYHTYDSKNIGQVLEKCVAEAMEKIDTKFILIISPEIDKYLEWASAEKRMHKAQIVRDAIEVMMNKDKNYKEFLKSIS